MTLKNYDLKCKTIKKLEKTYHKNLNNSKKSQKKIGFFKKEDLLKKECIPKTNFYCRWPKSSPFATWSITQLEQKIGFVSSVEETENKKRDPQNNNSPPNKFETETPNVEIIEKEELEENKTDPSLEPISHEDIIEETGKEEGEEEEEEEQEEEEEEEFIEEN